MADEFMSGSIEEAAALIERLSSPQQEEPAPAPVQTQAPAPEPEEEIQPQEAAPSAEVEGSVSEEAQAPAVEASNPAAATPAPAQAASSPELEQKLSEADKAKQEASAVRDQLLGQLNAIVPRLQASVAGQFSDIRSITDLRALADPNSPTYNPDRYNQYVIAQAELQEAQKHQAVLHQQSIQETTRSELEKVTKVIPEFNDPEKGPTLRAKLKSFAKTQGIDVENRLFLASDVLALHKLMTAQDKIAAFEKKEAEREAAKKAAEQKAAKAPPVQQPGSARESNGGDKAKELYGRAQKSGRIDDLAAYFDAAERRPN